MLDNALETDAAYRAGPDEPFTSKETLQRYSTRVVELNYQRNQIVDERIRAWREYHEANLLQSNSAFFTLCEEYWDLLEMGPSIIAPLMVEYYHHPRAYYYNLLHEIVHGRKLGAYPVPEA